MKHDDTQNLVEQLSEPVPSWCEDWDENELEHHVPLPPPTPSRLFDQHYWCDKDACYHPWGHFIEPGDRDEDATRKYAIWLEARRTGNPELYEVHISCFGTPKFMNASPSSSTGQTNENPDTTLHVQSEARSEGEDNA